MKLKNMSLSLISFLISYTSNAQDIKIQALKIGDHIPDYVFQNLSNTNKSSQNAAELYKDGLLIINFWETWCVPCVREMPYLDSIQSANGKQIHIVSVSIESKQDIDKFLLRHKDFTHLMYSSGDQMLSKYFPHSSIPHNVWIDKSGTVRAFTSDDEINSSEITKFFAGTDSMHMKKDTAFDFEMPLKVADSEFTYRSVFTGEKEEIGTGGIWLPDTNQEKTRFIGWNIPKIAFIWAAYIRGAFSLKCYNLLEIHAKDTSTFYQDKLFHNKNHHDWLDQAKMDKYYEYRKNNIYCYEMSFNHRVHLEDFYGIMTKEVDLFFNITAKIENRKTNCWVITKLDNSSNLPKSEAINPDELHFDGANLIANHQTWKKLALKLSDMYDNEPPFVDETGISYPVDINKNFGDLSDGFTIDLLKKYLNSIGLELSQKVVNYPHLIIYDHSN